LVDLGIKVEDRKPEEPSIWKYADKESIMKEKEEKDAAKKKKS